MTLLEVHPAEPDFDALPPRVPARVGQVICAGACARIRAARERYPRRPPGIEERVRNGRSRSSAGGVLGSRLAADRRPGGRMR